MFLNYYGCNIAKNRLKSTHSSFSLQKVYILRESYRQATALVGGSAVTVRGITVGHAHTTRACTLMPHPPPPPPRSAAIHTVAAFVVRSLSSVAASPEAGGVAVAWLFVCRQVYHTGEGLLALAHYALHTHIARALTKVGPSGRGLDQFSLLLYLIKGDMLLLRYQLKMSGLDKSKNTYFHYSACL